MAQQKYTLTHEGRPLNRDMIGIIERSPDQMLLQFLDGHTELLCICDHLEDIADLLLAGPDSKKCDAVAVNLLPTLTKSHRYEEETLFPWLISVHDARLGLYKSLTRLYFEHLEDEAYADEVVDMLQLISRGKRFEAETAGYMFRGFFEGLRRHIAFEQDHLYELIKPAHQSWQNA